MKKKQKKTYFMKKKRNTVIWKKNRVIPAKTEWLAALVLVDLCNLAEPGNIEAPCVVDICSTEILNIIFQSLLNGLYKCYVTTKADTKAYLTNFFDSVHIYDGIIKIILRKEVLWHLNPEPVVLSVKAIKNRSLLI